MKTAVSGRFRHFPPESNRFCRRYATVVGAVLPLESPLSFAELMIACREYALEYAEAGPIPELHESYVAWVLIHLIEYGMVTAVDVPPPHCRHPAGSKWCITSTVSTRTNRSHPYDPF